jgi:hypothetical protein
MCYIVKEVQKARDKGVPLIGISTSDQQATVATLRQELGKQNVPVIEWDFCQSFTTRTEHEKATLVALLGGKDARAFGGKPADALGVLSQVNSEGQEFVFVFHNAQRYLDALPVIQSVTNLRDTLKQAGAILVLLAPALQLPVELSNDVLLYDEPLPTDEQLHALLTGLLEAVELDAKVEKGAIDALRGLSLFAAEQVASLALRTTGFNLAAMWERKRQMIESTPGLSVWRGTGKFANIGGISRVKQFFTAIINGLNPPQVIVVVDEIDKVLGDDSHDSSSVSKDQLATLLSYMQDKGATGMIFIGPPGAAKTAAAQAAGNEAGIPTITLDLGGMKNSLVGSSEQRLRAALKMITAIGGGRVLFVATCNKIANLRPELRRRFNRGTFFFDLPTKEERELIWQLYCDKLDIPLPQPGEVDDTDWTGAEIQQCVTMAHELRLSLADAAGYVVPVAKAAHETIDGLRQQSEGRYLSASAPGLYKQPVKPETAKPKRKITL